MSKAARKLVADLEAVRVFAREVAELGPLEEERVTRKKVLAGLEKEVEGAKKELAEVERAKAAAVAAAAEVKKGATVMRKEAEALLREARKQAATLVAQAEEKAEEHEARMTRDISKVKALRKEAEQHGANQ